MSALSDSYQLEFWIPKGRKSGSWVQSGALPAGHHYSRTWRRVKPGHAHKDKLGHSLRLTAGYARDRSAQCDAYCQWARLAGLKTVTAFRDDHISNKSAKLFAFEPAQVFVGDFIGPLTVEEVLP